MNITLEQVLKAYDYATSHPHGYLHGTSNWYAAVAYSLNQQLNDKEKANVPHTK